MNNLIKGLILSSSLILSSCVGTVQETNTAITDISSNYTPTLNFTGLQSVKGISDSKIEIFFYSAAGGSGKYIYDIYVGNEPEPISVPSDVLTPDYRGLFRYTITDLEPMQKYQIYVQVRDQKSKAQSTDIITKETTTFTNLVTDFDGISSVANMPGQDGKDSILVRYNPARYVGSISGALDSDPIRYELVMVDADRLTPGDMDLELTSAQGKWVFNWNYDRTNVQNEYIARGLLPNRKYFARMRAIHKGTKQDPYNPHLRSELNTKYLEISTLSDRLADINFNTKSFVLSLPSGTSGLTTFQANWDQINGVFDHLRLYYRQKGALVTLPKLCLSQTQDPSATTFCKRLHYTETSTIITGLEAYTEYEAMLVICQTASCGELERKTSLIEDIITDPATIFNGIASLTASTDLNGSEVLRINYLDPSGLGGHFDGLILKMRRSEDESSPEVEITTLTDPVFHYPYDASNSDQITVGGIDYLTDQPYCFRLYPYKWNADRTTIREIPNENWKCITPKIQAPDGLSFLGFETGSSTREYVSLDWLPPTSGFFTNYVIFWKKGAGAFLWSQAIAAFNGEVNDYNYKMIDGSKTSHTFEEPFEDGEHTFGILTYHVYLSDDEPIVKWSDSNSSFLRCNINSSSSFTINCF